MFFSMEALKAKKGDSLLIHYGTKEEPTLVVVDGGPSGVYRRTLSKRLRALRDERAPGGSLPIRLLMVSHIDDDHIKGVLDLTKELRELRKDKKPLPYDVQALWHNSFDDVVGNHVEAFVTAAQGQIGEAGITGDFDPDLELQHPEAAMVLASVPQGRQLRDDAKLLGMEVNPGFESIVTSAGGGSLDPPIADGLEIVVVGPNLERATAFQKEWDKELKKRGLDRPEEVDVAAYLDNSVWNLASIVTLLRVGRGEKKKEMLLTGDGRGDYILSGMEEAGLFENGKRHVNLLKLPHHGSSNNVELDFFQSITADHYVVSGDGSHGNPNVETFEMLFEARKGDDREFHIHLTYPSEDFKEFRREPYPVADLKRLLDAQKEAGRRFEVTEPSPDALSSTIDLLEPFE